jgi:hypothetical protein
MFFSLDLPVTKNQMPNTKFYPKFFVIVSIQTKKEEAMKWQQNNLADIWCLVFVF